MYLKLVPKTLDKRYKIWYYISVPSWYDKSEFRKEQEMTLTQEQKELAISKARAMLRARMDWARNHRSNSYSAWGNDQCISRTSDAIDTMVNDTASSRRWQYWFNVLVVM